MKIINKNKKVQLLIILLSLFFLLAGKLPKEDLFKSILNISKGTIVESGVKIVSENGIDNGESVQQILNNLNIDEKHIKDYRKTEKVVIIEFERQNLRGYIQQENVIDKKLSRTTLVLIEESSENSLGKLKEDGKQIFNENMQIYSYMKAKIDTGDLDYLNKKIRKNLNCNLNDINTIKIINGYSNFLEKEAFQYALINYSSGNYLIMGEPQIFELY